MSHILLQTLIDMEKRHPGLAIEALTAALFACVLTIVAALSAADSGTSFGTVFAMVERF